MLITITRTKYGKATGSRLVKTLGKAFFRTSYRSFDYHILQNGCSDFGEKTYVGEEFSECW